MDSYDTAVVVQRPLQLEGDPLPVELTELTDPLFQVGGFVVGFVTVILVGWVVLEPGISRLVRGRNRNNPTLEEAISRYVRVLVVIFALFVGLTTAGFTGIVGSSALVVAAGMLALGVAGQSVIGSLVSGLALVTDSQFKIGDYIRWEGGEGEVTSITLRVTRVRTIDGGLVTIPNTKLTDDSIAKPFEGGTVRTVDRISIGYDADIESTLSLLTTVTEGIDGILTDPGPSVGIEELGDDAVVLRVQYWVENPRQNLHSVQSSFAQRVKTRLEQADVEISPASKRDLEGRIQVDSVP